MSKDLLSKAEDAIAETADLKELKYLKKELREKFEKLSKNEVQFYLNFMRTGSAYKSYQAAFNPNMSLNVAAVLANRLLKKVKINFIDYLEYAGHGPDKIAEALDALFLKDKDQYLKHITKLKQLDVQKVEHSGKIDLPVINIVTEKHD